MNKLEWPDAALTSPLVAACFAAILAFALIYNWRNDQEAAVAYHVQTPDACLETVPVKYDTVEECSIQVSLSTEMW